MSWECRSRSYPVGLNTLTDDNNSPWEAKTVNSASKPSVVNAIKHEDTADVTFDLTLFHEQFRLASSKQNILTVVINGLVTITGASLIIILNTKANNVEIIALYTTKLIEGKTKEFIFFDKIAHDEFLKLKKNRQVFADYELGTDLVVSSDQSKIYLPVIQNHKLIAGCYIKNLKQSFDFVNLQNDLFKLYLITMSLGCALLNFEVITQANRPSLSMIRLPKMQHENTDPAKNSDPHEATTLEVKGTAIQSTSNGLPPLGVTGSSHHVGITVARASPRPHTRVYTDTSDVDLKRYLQVKQHNHLLSVRSRLFSSLPNLGKISTRRIPNRERFGHGK